MRIESQKWLFLVISTEIEAAAAAAAAAASTHSRQHKKHKYTKKSYSSGLNISFFINKQWFYGLQCMYCTAAATAAAAAATAAAAAATIEQQKEYPYVFALIIIP